MDDGPTRYAVVENVCITSSTAGLKVGHVVDQITVSNNIVLSYNTSISGTAFEVPKQPANNTNAFTKNVLVNMDYNNKPWQFSSYCQQNNTTTPPPSTVDDNLYFARNKQKLKFCGSYDFWTTGLGLDKHSLFRVDPQLENIDPGSEGYPFSIKVAEGSPALLQLGFQNFKYGPRDG